MISITGLLMPFIKAAVSHVLKLGGPVIYSNRFT